MIEQYTSPVAVNNSQEPWLVGEGVVVSGGVAIPSLDFNFITGGLPGTVTFTRASTATYFNSAGVLTSAAINEPRFDYNPATLAARGLLIEEQRANSLTYSEDLTDASWVKNGVTISSNAIVAPDGLTTADKMDETAVTSGHGLDKSFSYVSGTTYTISYFVKAAERSAINHLFPSAAFGSNLNARFDLTTGAFSSVSAGVTTFSQDVGNGWWRIAFTATATASVTTVIRINLLATIGGSTSYLGVLGSGLYFWGAQLEVGAFPTSYIPTTTTALTRSADVATMSTLTPWFNATEGTLYAEYLRIASTNSQQGRTFSFSDNTTNNLIELYQVGANTPSAQMSNGGVLQAQWLGTTYAAGNIAKQTLAYALNNTNAAFNGTVQTIDTSCTVPSVTKVNIGNRTDLVRNLNGYVRRVTYYPRRLSDAELQSITT